ncbi:transmembrane adaptor Erv26-domain-containing protein [Flammula alnicola]|nr:transmembrane adaptor Erv26-domain-containing protein [Flammula alnicola]
MGLLYYVSYFAMLAAFCFVTLSLASGLLYVSELIEEHSRLAKLIGQRSIYVIMVLHVVFYFTDSLPLLQILFSLACHLIYLQNFSSTWPLISLTSITFLASCALVIVDHFVWFFYFARTTSEVRHLRAYRGIPAEAPSFTEIASFFAICVWYTPLFLFLSLSANDNALPMTAAEPLSPTAASSTQTSQSRVSLIRSMFSFLSFDNNIPRLRSRPSRKDTSEGIIAPRSPALPRAPLPQVHASIPSSPSLRPSAYPPPPRSPGPRTQEFDLASGNGNSSNFKLDTPPRRTRQVTGDGLGLGISLRRTASYMADDR